LRKPEKFLEIRHKNISQAFKKLKSEAPRGPPPADGASLIFLPLVEDPAQAWGED
jgi:hypothetical protein